MVHHRQRASILVGSLVLMPALALLSPEADVPRSPIRAVTENLHGTPVTDPYRWLEDSRSPATRAWIEAQNEYSRSVLQQLPGRERLEQRVSRLLEVDTVDVPLEQNGRYFFFRRRPGEDLPILYLRRSRDGEDEVLLDPNRLSGDHSRNIQLMDISSDGRLLAYGVREGGEDEVAVRLMQVDSGRPLPDRLPRGRYFNLSIRPDGRGFYYARHGSQGSRVYYHRLGGGVPEEEIFGEGYGPDKIVSCGLSEDGRFLIILVIHGSAADQTEVYLKDLQAEEPVRPIVNDLPARFLPQMAAGVLFLQTNWKAPRNRVLRVDPENPEREHWEEIIPEREAVLEEMELVGGKILLHYLDRVRSRLAFFETDGRPAGELRFPVIGSVGEIRGRWQSPEVFFSFSSFHLPRTIYRYHLPSRQQSVWSRVEAPLPSGPVEVRQIWYRSADGTRIPMFVVHRRGLELDASHPTLLTGYGGFLLSRLPGFSPRAALWVDQGGVFALPSLRGGGEFGEAWHRAGMREKKQNVFDDFIAAAEWLIQQGYTRPSRLAVAGRSNGGLLVGAALTQRPDLFRAVVCAYPLLDMLRYHRFLVARFWVPEYGSSEDPDQFRYLHRYSPYHRVQPGTEYPAVLLVTGDADTRVDPLHARKMTARLQAAGSRNPILLRYDSRAGHAGRKPVSRSIQELTDELAFLLWQTGNKP